MSVETETYVYCDGCGKEVYNEYHTVLCNDCSVKEIPSLSNSGYCSPILFEDIYTCTVSKQDFQWVGELPEYCPRCGRQIK